MKVYRVHKPQLECFGVFLPVNCIANRILYVKAAMGDAIAGRRSQYFVLFRVSAWFSKEDFIDDCSSF